ncbi:YbbR family protein [Alkalidesulfovibrio alkalitolerans DSM 16529]|uniref:YbbR family protein n=1 Tax=Alkalidesulfovibrio alkalitolerans DSM 16529 TaxID=1121439 RepID=S7TC74_9BACT|nr:CdaR family protein [Alkalidesulfovibrio alkalitolerans]EPR34787.1 YbbR family protein [Alkalidesulfovibrio alkalitolerans DSM 16529]
MRGNWQYMMLALVLAMLSWYLVSGRERVEVWVEVYVVSANTPKGLVVMEGLPSRLEARIRGPQGLMRNINPADLVYVLNLSDIRAGENVIVLNPAAIPLSGAITPLEIKPARLTLIADAVVEKTVDVRPVTRGELRDGFELKDVRLVPAAVRVRGPQSVVEGLADLATKPFDLDAQLAETVERRLPLNLPEGVEADPSQVMARVMIGPITTQMWVRLPVESPPGMPEVRIDPTHVRLHLELPEYLARDQEFRNDVRIRIAPGTDVSPGEREVVLVYDLPAYTRVIEARPERVRVRFPEPQASGPQ